MSLTRRLVISFVVILSLSLSSILVHIWANDVRKEKVARLQDVIRTQSTVNEFGENLQAMQKKILVVETLREADNSEVLTDQEKQDIAERIDELRQTHQRLDSKLQRYLETSAIAINAEEMLLGWKSFITAGAVPGQHAPPRSLYSMVMDRLTKNEWLLLARSDSINHELKGVVSLTNRITLGVFFISLIITFLLGYHVIGYTRRSIRLLQRGTTEWGEGHLGYQIPPMGGDELGQLADSFNEMATKLRGAMDDVREASRQAEAANQAKSSFLANMSHELRTPMNAIIGYSEMLMEEAEEAPDLSAGEFRPDLEKILEAGKHLLDLINDVLDISKIESGKMAVYVEQVDLKKLLEDVQVTVQPLIAKNQNILAFDFNVERYFIQTDITRFRQVVLNLLSNAAKFTRDGVITLAVEPVDFQGESMLEVSVADTGIGMSEEQVARVFDAFIQADLSTTKLYGGSGLGLTISKKFAELLGGDILVESQLGKGSCFRFILPLVESPEQLEMRRQPAHGGEPSIGKVLVIDDDPAALDISQRVLSREGCEVLVAGSGPAGLDVALRENPDVVILDVMMPGMDGWQVLKALRAEAATAGTPVLMLSMLNERDLGLLLGADEYLTKPIDRERLAAAVRALLPTEQEGNLLLVESDGALAGLIEQELPGGSWELFKAEAIDQVEAMLEAVPFQLVVIGHYENTDEAAGLVEKLHADERFRDIPVLLLQAEQDASDGLEQLRSYLRKHLGERATPETGVEA